jgi:threonine dehydrogenase-like Zn-dependent dehydrogenase
MKSLPYAVPCGRVFVRVRPGKGGQGFGRQTQATGRKGAAWAAVPSGGGHVIVCGLNHLGVRIIEQLRGAGLPAVVVDDHADSRLLRHLRRLGVDPVLGPSQEADILDRAGLRTAIALISCAENDPHNLETVLLARERQPFLRTVARIVNPQLAAQVRGMAPDVEVIDVAAMSAPSFVEACLLQRAAAAMTPASAEPD